MSALENLDCRHCGGKGSTLQNPGESWDVCPACDGVGRVEPYRIGGGTIRGKAAPDDCRYEQTYRWAWDADPILRKREWPGSHRFTEKEAFTVMAILCGALTNHMPWGKGERE